MSENVGTFQAFYSVINPPSTHSQAFTDAFFMRVATVAGTAGEKLTSEFSVMYVECT